MIEPTGYAPAEMSGRAKRMSLWLLLIKNNIRCTVYPGDTRNTGVAW